LSATGYCVASQDGDGPDNPTTSITDSGWRPPKSHKFNLAEIITKLSVINTREKPALYD